MGRLRHSSHAGLEGWPGMAVLNSCAGAQARAGSSGEVSFKDLGPCPMGSGDVTVNKKSVFGGRWDGCGRG